MTNLPVFRDMIHWNTPISADEQVLLFLKMGEEFYYQELVTASESYNKFGKKGFSYRLADKVAQRWRKGGLTVYGSGKWYLTDLGKNTRQLFISKDV